MEEEIFTQPNLPFTSQGLPVPGRIEIVTSSDLL